MTPTHEERAAALKAAIRWKEALDKIMEQDRIWTDREFAAKLGLPILEEKGDKVMVLGYIGRIAKAALEGK